MSENFHNKSISLINYIMKGARIYSYLRNIPLVLKSQPRRLKLRKLSLGLIMQAEVLIQSCCICYIFK